MQTNAARTHCTNFTINVFNFEVYLQTQTRCDCYFDVWRASWHPDSDQKAKQGTDWHRVLVAYRAHSLDPQALGASFKRFEARSLRSCHWICLIINVKYWSCLCAIATLEFEIQNHCLQRLYSVLSIVFRLIYWISAVRSYCRPYALSYLVTSTPPD